MSSRLDYCNTLFRSLSSFHMHKLKCIQNTLGRIVTNCNRYSRATPILKKLHWLPVEFRSPKLFQPSSVYLLQKVGTRYNRPEKRFLEVPQFYPSVHKSKNHFGHSLAFDAPTLWNDLPDDVRSAPTLASFRKKLNSYLFDKTFPP